MRGEEGARALRQRFSLCVARIPVEQSKGESLPRERRPPQAREWLGEPPQGSSLIRATVIPTMPAAMIHNCR